MRNRTSDRSSIIGLRCSSIKLQRLYACKLPGESELQMLGSRTLMHYYQASCGVHDNLLGLFYVTRSKASDIEKKFGRKMVNFALARRIKRCFKRLSHCGTNPTLKTICRHLFLLGTKDLMHKCFSCIYYLFSFDYQKKKAILLSGGVNASLTHNTFSVLRECFHSLGNFRLEQLIKVHREYAENLNLT